MTDVTDKMMWAALEAWHESGCDNMRSAIEAALAAREPVAVGELVTTLRGSVMRDFGLSYLGNASADALEELVATLKPFASLHGDPLRSNAHALLTRRGVKL